MLRSFLGKIRIYGSFIFKCTYIAIRYMLSYRCTHSGILMVIRMLYNVFACCAGYFSWDFYQFEKRKYYFQRKQKQQTCKNCQFLFFPINFSTSVLTACCQCSAYFCFWSSWAIAWKIFLPLLIFCKLFKIFQISARYKIGRNTFLCLL